MKVIYSTDSHLGGDSGLSKVVFEAGRALYKDGSLERVITYRNKQNEIPRHLVKRIIFQPAKLFSSLPARYYYTMKRMWVDYRTAQYLETHSCDIFHGWNGACLRSCYAAKKNNVVSIVESAGAHPRFAEEIMAKEFEVYGVERKLEPSAKWLNAFDGWRRLLEENCEEFEIADYVFVNSLFCYETFIKEGYPKEKLVMFPRGFDPQRYQHKPQQDSTFRAVFVGQLVVRKGLKYLLEAWSRLNLKNAELLLVGRLIDEAKSTVEPYLSRSDVRHIGFVENPADAYNSATVFVFPSVSEGSAKVTYEAMACGLPVIVTPNAGSLTKDGEDGFIIPIRNVEALMEKLLYFYENRAAAKDMGMVARENIQPYTWDKYKATLIDTYRKLLNK